MVDVILGEDATVAAAVQARSAEIAALVETCVAAIADGGTVHYLGAGTSGRLAVLDAVELAPTFDADESMVTAHLAGGPGAFLTAVEGAEDSAAQGAQLVREQCREGDVVIGLAASGRTPFVAGALEAARAAGMPTALISANPAAPLAPLLARLAEGADLTAIRELVESAGADEDRGPGGDIVAATALFPFVVADLARRASAESPLVVVTSTTRAPTPSRSA